MFGTDIGTLFDNYVGFWVFLREIGLAKLLVSLLTFVQLGLPLFGCAIFW